MSAERVRTKSRGALNGMFGEQVKLGGSLATLTEGTGQEEARGLEAETQALPAELVLYLKSLVPNLPELITDLTSETVEAAEEKEAARLLWERFGLPQSPLAVPIFAELSEDLSSAQLEVQEKSYNVQALISRVERAIQKVLLFYAAEFNRLEEEQTDNNQAIDQLGAIETDGSTMRERTAESVMVFSSEEKALNEKQEELRASQSRWLEFVQKLKAKLPTLEFLERPIDLGAPNPAMAL
ncbi:MAG: hypothetical protein ABII10_01840 [Candidatus Paceibacterota bacterium]